MADQPPNIFWEILMVKQFTPVDTTTRWVDWGTDNYAGVTFSNTGKRNIFMGWMSNWQYAQDVPTDSWRSAMTIPRDLGIKAVNKKCFCFQNQSKELNNLSQGNRVAKRYPVKNNYNLSSKTGKITGLFQLELSDLPLNDFSIVLANDEGDELVIGYDKANNQYYIDRTQAGKKDFEPGFAKKHTAPRIAVNKAINIKLIADIASVELFADDGLTVMTDIFFPRSTVSKISIRSGGLTIKNLKYTKLKPALK